MMVDILIRAGWFSNLDFNEEEKKIHKIEQF